MNDGLFNAADGADDESSKASKSRTHSLREELKLVAWLRKNRKVANKVTRVKLSSLCQEEIGIEVNATQWNRLADGAGVPLKQRATPSGGKDNSGNFAELARVLRRIGRDLGTLTPEEDLMLTALVARRNVGGTNGDA